MLVMSASPGGSALVEAVDDLDETVGNRLLAESEGFVEGPEALADLDLNLRAESGVRGP